MVSAVGSVALVSIVGSVALVSAVGSAALVSATGFVGFSVLGTATGFAAGSTPVAPVALCSVCTVWAGSVPPVAGSAKTPTGHRLISMQTVSSIAIHLFMFTPPY